VRHPSEVLSVGQEVTAKILKFDQENNRVSLGINIAPRIVPIAEIGEGAQCALAWTGASVLALGMTAEALLRSDAPLDLLPIAPSRAVDPARSQKASSIFHRLVTTCGKPRSPSGFVPFGSPAAPASAGRERRCRLIDGRHLGCSGPRSSSRKNGRCGPGPACVRASDTW